MKLIVALLTTTILFISHSVTAQNSTITATVVNVTSDSGKIAFALYDKTTFNRTPLQGAESKIIDGKSIVVFENVVPGEYAIICYHDKNNNDKMDFEANGMPLEDFGASNNNMSFSPPKFDDAKFVISDKDVSLNIKL